MRVILIGDWGKQDERLANALKAAQGENLFQILLAGAKVILRWALIYTPVDTGFLRSTGQLDREDTSPIVGYAADYASFVEFGTSRMSAQPYLRPAIDEHMDEIETEMMKVVESKVQ
jgi:HK97 gp10 family phage protein